MRRVAQNVLHEPPIRLLVKTALSNRLARRWAFKWAALYDAVSYPAYALGLQTACRYAGLAGGTGFTAIEFGVAGGNGLRELSAYAEKISEDTGLEIRIAGFDTGAGLPPNSDYRDAPWLWKAGDFPCELERLRRSIPAATELIVGRLEDTLPRWLVSGVRLPIGFVSVDVDYFSSSEAILRNFEIADVRSLLPFVSFYFDDILRFLTPAPVGELAALMEFNASSTRRKFDRDDWLSEDRPFKERLWLKRMYSLACFDHPSLSGSSRKEIARLDLVQS